MLKTWNETIAEMARTEPKIRFTTLAHRLNPHTLTRAFKRLNRNTAPGPDGIRVEEYGQGLEARIDTLWKRLKTQRYRASPAKRVYIPKPDGRRRPLAIPNVEDRIVQKAVAMVLEPIYEQDFLDLSYGFRPDRSAKDAVEVVRKTIDKRPIRVVVDADIKGFFDNLDHKWLRAFLGHRIADRGLLRVIGKFLNAGVVEDGHVQRGKKGCPQGGPLSPLLANIYLHYVLDLWFEKRLSPHLKGESYLIRYADDFIMCFEHPEDADEALSALQERLSDFGLELETAKSRMVQFGTEQGPPGPGPGSQTFDFLGFTFYVRKRGERGYRTATKVSQKSRHRFLREARDWLKKHLHRSVWFHQEQLRGKLRGFVQYFGVRYSLSTLRHIRRQLHWLWRRALIRRSQKAYLSWTTLKRKPWFKLPEVRLRESQRRSAPAAKEVRPSAIPQLQLFPTKP